MCCTVCSVAIERITVYTSPKITHKTNVEVAVLSPQRARHPRCACRTGGAASSARGAWPAREGAIHEYEGEACIDLAWLRWMIHVALLSSWQGNMQVPRSPCMLGTLCMLLPPCMQVPRSHVTAKEDPPSQRERVYSYHIYRKTYITMPLTAASPKRDTGMNRRERGERGEGVSSCPRTWN